MNQLTESLMNVILTTLFGIEALTAEEPSVWATLGSIADP